ncbi:MAG: nucleotidyltransferase domain-containing protein [Oligoflexales bacterium]|nr:nucleotidyltransferase domain-containing protein [Oligoflexales bacterium]
MKNFPQDYGVVIEMLQRACPRLISIYAFGSYGTKDQNKESDIDVAFLTHEELSSLERFELQEKIASIYSRDLDLIDIRLVSTVFQFQIISQERRIFCSDEIQACEFEAAVLSDYLRLQEERKDILLDFVAGLKP